MLFSILKAKIKVLQHTFPIINYIQKFSLTSDLFSAKRASLSAFTSGGLTLEAAIILPLLITLFLIMQLPLHIFNTQILIQERLTKLALSQSSLYYAYELINSDAEKSDSSELSSAAASALSLVYAKNQILDEELRIHLSHSFVKKGGDGLSLTLSTIDTEKETLDFSLSYEISPDIFGLHPFDFHFVQRCLVRGYSGRSLSLTADHIPLYVYITFNTRGVYHRSPYCSYLHHCTKAVIVEHPPMGNSSIHLEDGVYDCCAYCYINDLSELTYIYITEYGYVFHTSMNCFYLQRQTIRMDVNELGDTMRPCSRCY